MLKVVHSADKTVESKAAQMVELMAVQKVAMKAA